jgi:hypothetical protein
MKNIECAVSPIAALRELRRCRKSLPICLNRSCLLLLFTTGIGESQSLGPDLLRVVRCRAAGTIATDTRASAVDLLQMQQGPIPYTTFLARRSVLADGLTKASSKSACRSCAPRVGTASLPISNGAAAVFRAPLTTGSASPHCVFDIYDLSKLAFTAVADGGAGIAAANNRSVST